MSEVDVTQITLNDNTLVLVAGKTIDNTNVRQFSTSLGEARSAGNKFIIVDMSELEFLSSAGVGAIFSQVQRYRDTGGDIILCNLSEPILFVLTELDVAEHLTIVPNRDEAARLAEKGA